MILLGCSMMYSFAPRKLRRFGSRVNLRANSCRFHRPGNIGAGTDGAISPGQYPPGRPQPIVLQCQNALVDRVSADAGRRVDLNLDTQDLYSAPNERQGVRGRMRYGIGGPNTWRTATCECIVDHRSSRVERAHYRPQADNTGWPGGPAYPGGPGGPGIPNYPRVRVDTSGSSSRSVGNVNITRGFVDSAGARPSISLRGGNFRITFYGVVENSVGGGFTMRITGSEPRRCARNRPSPVQPGSQRSRTDQREWKDRQRRLLLQFQLPVASAASFQPGA